MKSYQLSVPPTIAVSLNATTPVPDGKGAVLWSSVTNSLLTWNGTNWISVSNNITSTSFSITQFTVDFGNLPVLTKTFVVSIPGLLTTNKVSVTASGIPTVTGMDDELEMNAFTCSAQCKTNNNLTVTIHSLLGPVMQQFNFNLMIG